MTSSESQLFNSILACFLLGAAKLPAQVSLSEAVDTPGLAWTAGGDIIWEGRTAEDAKSGGNAARCGPMTLDPYFSTGEPVSGWMETTVTGPGSFRVFVRSNLDPYLEATLSVDGMQVAARALDYSLLVGTGPWRVLACPLPAGPHTLRLTACLGCGAAGTLPLDGPFVEADFASIIPPSAAAGEAMDAPQQLWLDSGGTGFSLVTDVSIDGVDSLYAASQTDAAWVETQIEGPATVSWWRKGRGTVTINGLAVTSAFLSEWAEETAFVPPGTQWIRWDTGGSEMWLDAFAAVPESLVGISEALDAPGRIFNASPGWQAHTTGTASSGGDLAWARITHSTEHIETTVAGPAVVQANWRIRGTGSHLSAIINGQRVRSGWGLRYEENTGVHQLMVPPGLQPVSWEVTRLPGDLTDMLVMLDAVQVTPASVTLPAAALDDASLTWTTGGDASWLGVSAPVAFDGTDFVTNPPLNGGQSAWLETTVTGPGSLSFQWQSMTDNSTVRRVVIDEAMVKDLADFAPRTWRRDVVEVPAGPHTVRFECRDACGAGAMLIDDARWVAAPVSPLMAALDFAPEAVYAEANHAVDTTIHTDGADALRIEPPGDTQVTEVTLWVPGPALASITARCAETTFSLSSDGSHASTASGDWTTLTVSVPPGLRPVRFRTSRFYNNPAVLSAAWVDAFTTLPLSAPLDSALGTPGREWTTNPANPWGGIADGAGLTMRAVPGPQLPGVPSWLETTVAGPAVVAFTAAGHLQLYLDSAPFSEVNTNSTSGFFRRTVYVPPGVHKLKWEDSLDSYHLPSLSGVSIAAMSAAPSAVLAGNKLIYTIPRPQGYEDESIRIESSIAGDAFYPSHGYTVLRSSEEEFVVSFATLPSVRRWLLRARFMP